MDVYTLLKENARKSASKIELPWPAFLPVMLTMKFGPSSLKCKTPTVNKGSITK